MNILIAEDDGVTLRKIESQLEKWGHTISTARNGLEAWNSVTRLPIDIVISDWQMPETTGLELCLRIRETRFPHYIYFIMISGNSDQEDVIEGLENGVDDYLIKPVDFKELNARLKTAARIIQMERQLTDKYNEIEENYFQTIQMFVRLIEHFNEKLGSHCRRVADTAVRMAALHPDFPKEDLKTIETLGLLHDIGMIGLPNSLIAKTLREMNFNEMELYKSHPVHGEHILKEIKFLKPISKLVRAHHEQYNGRGFPDGLAGNDIPMMAKMVSAASVYDNLVQKSKTPLKEIPDMLNLQKGYQLDPECVDLLFRVNAENIKRERKENTVILGLDKLKDGMILARSVRRPNGALILPKNTKLTFHEIDKLQNYYKLEKITEKLTILKSSIRE